MAHVVLLKYYYYYEWCCVLHTYNLQIKWSSNSNGIKKKQRSKLMFKWVKGLGTRLQV